MIYPIVPYGQPVLRRQADIVPEDYPNLKQLVADMFETLAEVGGVGLAAPQIDLSLRLFIVDVPPIRLEEGPSAGVTTPAQQFRKAFINPQLLEEDGEPWGFDEGCLSFPGLYEEVYRRPVVKVRYQDEDFQWHEATYDGYVARVFQHEYDHIEGKTFVDHLSTLRRAMLKKRLDKIARGDVRVDYRMKWGVAKKRK
ncbi:MAG: peptide deformylase [Bacteroidales bacterium]|nr:peptide deformylase [Bacteroidales bacterium]